MSGGESKGGNYTKVRSQPKCTSKQLASTMIKPSQLHPVLIKLSTMYFDAHCHLDFNAFDGDRGHVFERAAAVGVSRFLVAGVHPDDWPRQRKLAREQPGVFWTAGIHPVAAAQMSPHALSDGLTALPREWREGPWAGRGGGNGFRCSLCSPRDTPSAVHGFSDPTRSRSRVECTGGLTRRGGARSCFGDPPTGWVTRTRGHGS